MDESEDKEQKPNDEVKDDHYLVETNEGALNQPAQNVPAILDDTDQVPQQSAPTIPTNIVVEAEQPETTGLQQSLPATVIPQQPSPNAAAPFWAATKQHSSPCYSHVASVNAQEEASPLLGQANNVNVEQVENHPFAPPLSPEKGAQPKQSPPVIAESIPTLSFTQPATNMSKTTAIDPFFGQQASPAKPVHVSSGEQNSSQNVKKDEKGEAAIMETFNLPTIAEAEQKAQSETKHPEMDLPSAHSVLNQVNSRGENDTQKEQIQEELIDEKKSSQDILMMDEEDEEDGMAEPEDIAIDISHDGVIDYDQQNNLILQQLVEEEAPEERIISGKLFYKEMQKLKERGTSAVPPKKHASAYIMFQKEKRPEILKRNPMAKVTEVVKEIAFCWGKMIKTDKQKYKDAAKRDKERYERELKHLHSFSKNLKKPKKCLSAYMIFVQETRPLIVKLNPRMGALQVMKQVGKAWQSMTHLQRQYFKNKADNDKVRYLKQMKEFYDEVEQIGNRVGTVRSNDGIYNVAANEQRQIPPTKSKGKDGGKAGTAHMQQQKQQMDMLHDGGDFQQNLSSQFDQQQAYHMGQQRQMFDAVTMELATQNMISTQDMEQQNKGMLGKRSKQGLPENIQLDQLNNNMSQQMQQQVGGMQGQQYLMSQHMQKLTQDLMIGAGMKRHKADQGKMGQFGGGGNGMVWENQSGSPTGQKVGKKGATAFLIFSEDFHEIVKLRFPVLSKQQIMEVVTKKWKMLSKEQRLPFEKRQLQLQGAAKEPPSPRTLQHSNEAVQITDEFVKQISEILQENGQNNTLQQVLAQSIGGGGTTGRAQRQTRRNSRVNAAGQVQAAPADAANAANPKAEKKTRGGTAAQRAQAKQLQKQQMQELMSKNSQQMGTRQRPSTDQLNQILAISQQQMANNNMQQLNAQQQQAQQKPLSKRQLKNMSKQQQQMPDANPKQLNPAAQKGQPPQQQLQIQGQQHNNANFLQVNGQQQVMQQHNMKNQNGLPHSPQNPDNIFPSLHFNKSAQQPNHQQQQMNNLLMLSGNANMFPNGQLEQSGNNFDRPQNGGTGNGKTSVSGVNQNQQPLNQVQNNRKDNGMNPLFSQNLGANAQALNGNNGQNQFAPGLINNNGGNGAWNAVPNPYFMGAAPSNGNGAVNNGATPMGNFNLNGGGGFSSNPLNAAALLAGSLGTGNGNPNVTDMNDLLVQSNQAGLNNNPMINQFDLQQQLLISQYQYLLAMNPQMLQQNSFQLSQLMNNINAANLIAAQTQQFMQRGGNQPIPQQQLQQQNQQQNQQQAQNAQQLAFGGLSAAGPFTSGAADKVSAHSFSFSGQLPSSANNSAGAAGSQPQTQQTVQHQTQQQPNQNANQQQSQNQYFQTSAADLNSNTANFLQGGAQQYMGAGSSAPSGNQNNNNSNSHQQNTQTNVSQQQRPVSNNQSSGNVHESSQQQSARNVSPQFPNFAPGLPPHKPLQDNAGQTLSQDEADAHPDVTIPASSSLFHPSHVQGAANSTNYGVSPVHLPSNPPTSMNFNVQDDNFGQLAIFSIGAHGNGSNPPPTLQQQSNFLPQDMFFQSQGDGAGGSGQNLQAQGGQQQNNRSSNQSMGGQSNTFNQFNQPPNAQNNGQQQSYQSSNLFQQQPPNTNLPPNAADTTSNEGNPSGMTPLMMAQQAPNPSQPQHQSLPPNTHLPPSPISANKDYGQNPQANQQQNPYHQ